MPKPVPLLNGAHVTLPYAYDNSCKKDDWPFGSHVNEKMNFYIHIGQFKSYSEIEEI